MKKITLSVFMLSQVASALVYADVKCTMHEEQDAGTGNYSLTFTDTSCLNSYIKQQIADNIKAKADITYVTEQLSTKADTTYVNNQLDAKADKANVNTQLNTKADTTYVDSQLSSTLATSKAYTDQHIQELQTNIDGNSNKIQDNKDDNNKKVQDHYNGIMSVLSSVPNLLTIDYDSSCQPPSNGTPPYNVYLAALGNGGNSYNSDTAYFKVNTLYPSFITLSSWDGSGDAMASGVGIAITKNQGDAVDSGSKIFVTRENNICSKDNQNCSNNDLTYIRRLSLMNINGQKIYSHITNKNNTGSVTIIPPLKLDYNPFADNHDTSGADSFLQFTKPYGYIRVHCGS